MPGPYVANSQQTSPLPYLRTSRVRLFFSAGLMAMGALLATLAYGTAQAQEVIRVATYNASLYREKAGGLRQALQDDSNQAAAIAAVIQRVRPQLLLINEFDYDPEAAQLFMSRYLERAQPKGGEAIHYPHHFIAPSNTGVPSGIDLDRDGRIGGGNDALGFGQFPGQYGMLVLSMYNFDQENLRSFRRVLWKDMPNNLLPPGWYTDEALRILPLSSKSHWDLPIRLPNATGTGTVHFLVSHPTPPGFDGPEDRNGRRNHDEIRLWADYITGGAAADYLVDDQGKRGGLPIGESFVIAGDLNADPADGGSRSGAIAQLLEHPTVNSGAAKGLLAPRSKGAAEAAARQGGQNLTQQGDAALDTADFSEGPRGIGNLRVDYVLASKDLTVCRSGVFWPASDDPDFVLVNDDPKMSSDHRLVWLDIALPGKACPSPSDVVAE